MLKRVRCAGRLEQCVSHSSCVPIFVAGVAFVSDTVGYTGGVANGAGPEIFKTVNGT